MNTSLLHSDGTVCCHEKGSQKRRLTGSSEVTWYCFLKLYIKFDLVSVGYLRVVLKHHYSFLKQIATTIIPAAD